MKYLKLYNESVDNNKKKETNNARKWLSEIYDIVDEIQWIGGYVDFLVDVDKFMEYATEHDGSIAGNEFDDFEDVWYMIKQIKKLDGVDNVYVAPFWITRPKEDIVDFGDVYSDTLYILINDEYISEFVDDKDDFDLLHEIKGITNGHEVDIEENKSKLGNTYIRVWWD